MNEPHELTLLSHAQRALVEAQTVDQVKELRDQAEVVKSYAKKAKLGQHIIVEASMIKVQAERKLGQMLRSVNLADSAPGNQYTGPVQSPLNGMPENVVYLRDLGITKSESSRSQLIASIPEDVFQHFLKECGKLEREPTTAGLLRLARKLKEQNNVLNQPLVIPLVSSLQQLVDDGKKYPTIFVDPPWIDGTDKDSMKKTFEELLAEPVSELLAEGAHLHFRTTNDFLLEGLHALATWGFAYKSCLIIVTPRLGPGRYWRCGHEFLLLGVRGKVPFRSRKQRSWIALDQSEPDIRARALQTLIEEVSPGPYLAVFGAEQPLSGSWTVYIPCPAFDDSSSV